MDGIAIINNCGLRNRIKEKINEFQNATIIADTEKLFANEYLAKNQADGTIKKAYDGLSAADKEAFEKAADGKATKIIIPSEIQGVAGLAKAVVESVKEN